MRSTSTSLNLRALILLLLTFIMAALAQGQTVTGMAAPDYSIFKYLNIGGNRMRPTNAAAYLEVGLRTGSVKGMIIPRGNKNEVVDLDYGLIYYDVPTQRFVGYNGTEWVNLSFGEITIGTPTDTLVYSTRAWRQKGVDSLLALINARVKYTDTAAMLFPYARKSDLPLKLNVTDTADMLQPYVTEETYTAGLDTVVKYADTTGMFQSFLRKSLKFIYPLHYSNSGDSVLINITDAWANAQRIQGKTFSPRQPLNGQLPIFNDTMDQWVPGYIDGDGTMFIETDSIAQARIDSLLANWPPAANNNVNIGAGHRPLIESSQEVRTYFGTNGIIIDSTSNANALTWQVDSSGYATVNYALALYDILNASKVSNVDIYAGNNLVQPGYVTWSGTGLTFDVTAAVYDIENVRYNSAAGQITLDAADATNPRIDAIAVDNTGSIVKITGTAEANPVEPQIDPSTQVLLTTILLPAGATTPTDVSNDFIYDENTEWTSAAIGLTANFDNTSNNYNGSKSAAISGFSNGQAVQWTNGSLVAPANQVLSMQVRLSSNWNNSNNASIMLMRGAVPISQALLATNYGLVKSNSGGYQTVSIPITAFSPTDSFDRVRVTFIGNSGNTVNIDYVRLQSGVTTLAAPTFSVKAYNGTHKVGKDSVAWGGTLVEQTIIDAKDKEIVYLRKDNDNNTYVTSSWTTTGIDYLSKFDANKWAEMVLQSTGSYSGTYAWLRAAYGSSEGAVQVTPGSIILTLMANGNIYTDSTGIVKFPQYGAGTFTGTATKHLAVNADGDIIEVDVPSGGTGSPTWGDIGGLISDQTDLQTELDGKASTSHTHAASDITSGTLNTAQIAGGTATATYVPISNGDGTATWGPQASGGTATETKYWTIPAPTDTDNLGLFKTSKAITITSLSDVLIGTSPSVTYQIKYASTRNSGSPTSLFSSTRTTTSESGATTTTFANPSIPAGSYIWVEITGVTTTDQFEISMSWQ